MRVITPFLYPTDIISHWLSFLIDFYSLEIYKSKSNVSYVHFSAYMQCKYYYSIINKSGDIFKV